MHAFVDNYIWLHVFKTKSLSAVGIELGGVDPPIEN